VYEAFYKIETDIIYRPLLMSGSQASSKNALIKIWEETLTPTAFAQAGIELKKCIHTLLVHN